MMSGENPNSEMVVYVGRRERLAVQAGLQDELNVV